MPAMGTTAGERFAFRWGRVVVAVVLVVALFPMIGTRRSGAADPLPETAGRFVSLPPTRILDTRLDGLGFPRPYVTLSSRTRCRNARWRSSTGSPRCRYASRTTLPSVAFSHSSSQ